jgi:hypothetical protein
MNGFNKTSPVIVSGSAGAKAVMAGGGPSETLAK